MSVGMSNTIAQFVAPTSWSLSSTVPRQYHVREPACANLVGNGKLDGAIKQARLASVVGPWHAPCDNEGFLRVRVKESSLACKRVGVKLGRIPSKSPELSPIERFWPWLKKKLRHMDLADAMKGKPLLSKSAYKARIRGVLRSSKAQSIAKTCANSLRIVCKAVLKNKGAAIGF